MKSLSPDVTEWKNLTECLSQSAENVEGSRLTSKMSCLTRKNQSIETDSKMIE